MNKINDNDLDQVSGGKSTSWSHMVTRNSSTYSSGTTPKYRVGQALKIKFNDSKGHKHTCGCVVESVSDSASCGWWYKEFGYTVRITFAPQQLRDGAVLVGRVYNDVYESCLYEE